MTESWRQKTDEWLPDVRDGGRGALGTQETPVVALVFCTLTPVVVVIRTYRCDRDDTEPRTHMAPMPIPGFDIVLQPCNELSKRRTGTSVLSLQLTQSQILHKVNKVKKIVHAHLHLYKNKGM